MPHAVHESIYRSQPIEHAFVVEQIEGSIPAGLTGTFLRSGPGLLELGEQSLNFFDGHALIAGVSFFQGRAVFRSRFVRTPLYEQETAARAITRRRIFTNHPSRWANLFALDFGNGAMHDVYSWGDGDQLRIVAGNDPGHFALDPRTLATRGPETWAGAADPGKKIEMGPMPYRDPLSGRLIGWLKRPGGMRPDALRFVELDGTFAIVKATPYHPLGAAPVLPHDHRATPHWYVTVEQSVRLSVGAALWGKQTVYDSFRTPPGATATLLLVPRDGAGDGGGMIRVPLPAPIEMAFHVINAYERGDQLVIDLITYDGRIGFSAAASRAHRERHGYAVAHGPAPTPMRFVVDPHKGTIVEHGRLGDAAGEAPEIADAKMGQPYRFAYFPSRDATDDLPDRGGYFYFGALAKLDVDSGQTTLHRGGPDCVISPCAFVARDGGASEDDGWLLAYALHEDGARVVILDARTMQPVATLRLGIHLPGVSHTRWAPEVQLAP